MDGTPILVATDGSPAAIAAVDAALRLAAAMTGPVRFVHASAALADALYAEHPEDGPSREDVIARDAVLRDAAERAATAGVAAEVELISDADMGTGDLAAAIAGIAEGVNASLIVVGSRGRGPMSGSLLGSVSHNLIKWATVPVVVVNAPQERPAGA